MHQTGDKWHRTDVQTYECSKSNKRKYPLLFHFYGYMSVDQITLFDPSLLIYPIETIRFLSNLSNCGVMLAYSPKIEP